MPALAEISFLKYSFFLTFLLQLYFNVTVTDLPNDKTVHPFYFV